VGDFDGAKNRGKGIAKFRLKHAEGKSLKKQAFSAAEQL
jgi:hypothetical protein